jgi:hypothetical protein
MATADDKKKIHKAKLAYAKFLRDLHTLTEEQKQLLDVEVKKLETKKIEEIHQIIELMNL